MTGDVLYRRTQIAWPVIAPLAFTAAILAAVFHNMTEVPGAALIIVASVYGAVLLLFATLTVSVTSDGVAASFGIGLVRKWVPFVDVASFARARMRWINGWGIHSYPGGTLWNASGLTAIEFLLTSGKYVAVGTADADAFATALRQATGKAEGAHEPLTSRARTWGLQQTFGAIVGVLAVCLAGASIYYGMQEPTVIVGEDSLYVSNGLYRNIVPYRSMESLALREQLPRVGFKLNGFAVGKTMRGRFNVDGWGASYLYINAGVPPFVVIETPKNFLAVNFKDPARTRRLYGDLKAHAVRLPR